jgi:uncharacterized damage-inducible protein DinB
MNLSDAPLRQTLVKLLRGEGAHVSLLDALEGLPPEWRTHRPPGLHSIWQLLEHIRIAQHDLLHYTLDPAWRSPEWPDGYWPENRSDLPESAWRAAIEGYTRDLEALIALVRDPAYDLVAPLPHHPEHTPLRQLLLAADHTAYHTGQIVDLRRMLGDWPPKRRPRG